MPPVLLTVRQAAAQLAIGRSTMYELIAAGAIDVVRIGRSIRVPADAVDEFVDRTRVAHDPAIFATQQERPEPSANSARACRPPVEARRSTP